MLNPSPLAAGLTLQNRYRIVRELGRGGFGRTYLVEDTNQANEYCVLKEFAPQVQGNSELQKAKELFEREAGVLYQLRHPQIPRFRELLKVRIGDTESLFLVQDYIEGKTYLELLNSYQKRGQRFTEPEVTQLLLQLLPVLEYIHSLGVVHRDISPDNLIQRHSDQQPVLIDFGSVKQAAATAASLYSQLRPPTRIGKEGYAPDEQMHRGKPLPCSDLYALAVTVLVLLTGKEPKALYDASKATWHWQQEVSISRPLGSVLDKMLAYRPRDRFQSAQEVLQALQAGNSNVSQIRTINFVGRLHSTPHQASNTPHTFIIPRSTQKWIGHHWKALAMSMSCTLFVGIIISGLVKSGVTSWRPSISLPLPAKSPLQSTEQARQAKIIKRSRALKLSDAAFVRKVDQLFYSRHADLRKHSLTSQPEDADLRAEWYKTAEDLLDQLEKSR